MLFQRSHGGTVVSDSFPDQSVVVSNPSRGGSFNTISAGLQVYPALWSTWPVQLVKLKFVLGVVVATLPYD